MHRLGTGMLALGCVLWTFSQAAAQTDAQLKAKVDSLEREVALLKASDAAKSETKVMETRKVASEISADATQYATDFKIVWDDGVWFKSDDKFAFHVGGRMQVDWGWFRAPGIERDFRNNTPLGVFGADKFRDGVEMRSIRLLAEGTLYKYVNFKLEVDFHADDEQGAFFQTPNLTNNTAKGSDMVLRNAYLEMIELPCVGKVRVGFFKEPFSLEQQTDELFLTFLEPSAGNALVPGRNFGFMAHDAILGQPGAKRMTWAVGLFRQGNLGNAGDLGFLTLHPSIDNQDGQPVHSDQGYAVTGRMTALPYYAQGGEKLVHVGLAYSHRGTNDDRFARFMARPETHFMQVPLLDVTVGNADNLNVFGAEAALVYGPFSLQTEYMGASLNTEGTSTISPGPFGTLSNAENTVCFNAWYIQASYFVTGEHRPYDTEAGAFDRVRPLKNFRENGGWGAVEVATRYSYLDLDEENLATFSLGDFDGNNQLGGSPGLASRGEYNIWTLGVNWYLNPNTRVSAEYIRACPVMNVTSSSADIFMMRFQVDF